MLLPKPRRRPLHPSVLVTDLDGTLIRSNGTISERTRAALERAQRNHPARTAV